MNKPKLRLCLCTAFLLLLACSPVSQTPQPSKISPSPTEAQPIAGRLGLLGQTGTAAGAEVRLENGGAPTMADAEGRFQFSQVTNNPAPVLLARKTAGDGTPYSLRQPLQAGVDLQQLLLRPSGAIVGKVSAPGLSDLTGINVFIAGTSLGALTDAQGDFFLADIPAGSYTITARREGFMPVQVPVQVETGKPVAITLSLTSPAESNRPWATLSGQVLANGGPVAGARVQILGESIGAITDKLGKYRLSQVLPQARYTLQIAREGFESQEHELGLAAGEKKVQDFFLKSDARSPQGHLSGQLSDAQGQPIAGATLETEPATQRVTSNQAGHFDMPNILPGRYYLMARKEGVLKASRFVGIDPGQQVNVPLMGLTVASSALCDQQNVNNINVNIPGAQVTITVNNQNTCQFKTTE